MSKKPRLPKITEDEFMRQVLELAKLRGWRTAHFRPARTKTGWRTAVSGDGKGFPDLILLRGNRMIVAELKVGNNTATPEQEAWIDAFAEVPGVLAFIWHPEDWPEIETVLK